MKKALSLVLALVLVVFGSSAAFAEQIDISADNLGRGAGLADYGMTVSRNDDGTVTGIDTESISYYLPEAVLAGETVTVHAKGTSDGDFRMWLINTNEVTNSEIFKMSEHNDYVSGDFDVTFTLTALDESTEFFLKGYQYGENLKNVTLTYLDVTKGGEPAVENATDEEVVEKTEVVEVVEEAAPKTGETSTVVLLVGLMSLSLVVAVVLKKKELFANN